MKRRSQRSSDVGDAQLRLDVDGLVAVDGVHQRRRVELREVGAREAAVAVARPLHRRAHAVAVAEEDVVAHRDLVAVVEHRRAGQREQDGRHQLDLVAAVVEQRGQPPADAEVQLHARVLGVLGVHVVALLVGDHLERQLVVVAQEQAPLAVVGDRRRLLEDLVDRRGLLAPDRHEHARHHGEVERHVALVAVAEVLDHVRRPLVRLGEQHAVGVVLVDLPADALQVLVRLRAGSRRSCRRARRGTARRRAGSRRGRGRARSAARRASRPGPRGCRS